MRYMFWIVAATIVLVLDSTSSSDEYALPPNIKVGYLYNPSRDGKRDSGLAVISLAKKKLYENGIITNTTNLEIFHRIMECDPYTGAVGFVDMVLENNISALIGPPCAEPADVIGRLAVPYNILLLSHGSNSEEFTGEHVYKTFARTSLYSPSQTARATAMFIAAQGWKQVALVENSLSEEAQFLTRAITAIFLEMGLKVVLHIVINTENPPYEKYMKLIREKARIVVPIFSRSTSGSADFLLHALRAGMTNNEYAYIVAEEETDRIFIEHWEEDGANDTTIYELKRAYEAVFVVKVVALDKGRAAAFTKLASDEYTRIYPNRSSTDYQYTIYQPPLYDSVYTYGWALNLSVQASIQPFDGVGLFNLLRWQTFPGAVADVIFDERVERAPTYLVESFDFVGSWNRLYEIKRVRSNTTGRFDFGNEDSRYAFEGGQEKYSFVLEPVRPANWRTKNNQPPLDEPMCGFDGRLCSERALPLYTIAGIAAMIFVAIASSIIYFMKKNKTDKNLMQKAFLLDLRKLKKTALEKGDSSLVSFSTFSTFSKYSGGFGLAIYDGTPCHVECFEAKRTFVLDWQQLKKLEGFRHMLHENITSFIGVAADGPDSFVVLWQFVSSRSLRDVLHNTDIHLDDDFLSTFVKGVVGGLKYLHRATNIAFHGNLTTQTTLVDSRMVVKLSSYGLTPLIGGLVELGNIVLDQNIYDKYHMAPEVLIKMEHLIYHGSKASDIFSLSMVVYQILTRRELYEDYILTPEEIIAKVGHPTTSLMRPDIPVTLVATWGDPVKNILSRGWDHDPMVRPEIEELHAVIAHACSKFSGSIMEKMMDRMERYTANLEQLVVERTQEAKEQQKRAESLLMQLLPKSVAQRLQQGLTIEPESYSKCSILFTDIVSFTSLAAICTPIQVITFLNELYGGFDELIDKKDVYKVETVGDAYMVVSGVPNKTEKHAFEIVQLALDLRDYVQAYKWPFKEKRQVCIRLGCHSGPVVSGIVGSKMPRFCLFGDTVHIAENMESTGIPMKVQISKDIKKYIKNGNFTIYKRGEVELKGKGKVITYIVDKYGSVVPEEFIQKSKPNMDKVLPPIE